MQEEVIINNEKELENFAKSFSCDDLEGKIIILKGELGAGKTTFVKYFAKSLNCKELVSSPSYVLENIYNCEKNDKNIKVSHWDVYRLKSCPIDFFEEDFVNQIVFVEWGDKFEELKKEANIILEFNVFDDNKRKIKISKLR